ncbi:MAG: ROK family protein [Planctomycetaceae bacterium]|jgi:glucokinase|nr:ROK family protein [Planctomycetaceae bacterium]
MKDSIKNLYIGVDVGGTKIQASLITDTGSVLASNRRSTPRNCHSDQTIEVIEESIHELLMLQNQSIENLSGVGIAVPGVVCSDTGYIVVTPNMNLSGVELGNEMRERLGGIRVEIGNDCNLGTLGECWLGSGRQADTAVGIFVGTGIGAGIVREHRLVLGAGQVAGEIGHIILQIPCESWRSQLRLKKAGRKRVRQVEIVKRVIKVGKVKSAKQLADNSFGLVQCGCGNYGCFESIASRSAIERYIREAITCGAKSSIADHNGGKLDIIKSGSIAKALKSGDEVVTVIINYVSTVIGYACLTVRHLLDPDVIMLGGGVIEACQKYMMPVIESVTASDKLSAAPSSRRILVSSLGDSAVVLGAVALVRGKETITFDQLCESVPKYPHILMLADDVIHIDDVAYMSDILILSDGTIHARTKVPKKDPNGFRFKDIETVVQGGTDMLILATPTAEKTILSDKCREYLYRRGIDFRILQLREAVQLYNNLNGRRSAVFHFNMGIKN